MLPALARCPPSPATVTHSLLCDTEKWEGGGGGGGGGGGEGGHLGAESAVLVETAAGVSGLFLDLLSIRLIPDETISSESTRR